MGQSTNDMWRMASWPTSSTYQCSSTQMECLFSDHLHFHSGHFLWLWMSYHFEWGTKLLPAEKNRHNSPFQCTIAWLLRRTGCLVGFGMVSLNRTWHFFWNHLFRACRSFTVMVSVVLMIRYYFGTIYLCMNILYYIGVQVSLPNISFTCHVAFIACTCDLPARALLMNMNQFNGFYGCSKCLQKGNLILEFINNILLVQINCRTYCYVLPENININVNCHLLTGKIVKTDQGGNVLTFPYHVGNLWDLPEPMHKCAGMQKKLRGEHQ